MPNASVEMTFSPDHTFSIVSGPKPTTGTWRAEGKQLTMITHLESLSMDDISTCTIQTHDEELIFTLCSSISTRDAQQFGERRADGFRTVYKRAR